MEEFGAESEKGKGSRFYVSIPFKVDLQQAFDKEQKNEPTRENVTSQIKGIKILLVETIVLIP